ncbi:MAG: bifunctional ornithine acetyltransferase/N-acetylglutamate synthase [Euryarchaeota archaeon]|nr:bifunctional ornithine acetyltransferase/N-acetylglutamate synthase [Euryarchaeota archaeon]
MEETDVGVCVPGFKAAGIRKGGYGLAVILSEGEADCALMVTSNRVRAAPVLVSLGHAGRGKARGVVASSGNANCFTGEKGLEDAREMCRLAAGRFGSSPQDYIVNSTGVIGRRLDMDAIEALLEEMPEPASSRDASLAAAKAIMTTDTVPKMYSVRTTLETGEEVHIGGIAKGAGMIAPGLVHATMFCFLTTDARIPGDRIQSVLREAVELSFNMTVVDGDMSTNDMVCLLAGGTAGNKDIDENFQKALDRVCRELARMIARDGEGATKYLEVTVRNAATREDAAAAARAVAGSSLVKTAVFGSDPNWGRIIAALGYSGAEMDPGKVSLYLRGREREVCLVRDGEPLALEGTEELKLAEEVMKEKEIHITADLAMGEGEATAFGCDLGYDYVKINAEYTT